MYTRNILMLTLCVAVHLAALASGAGGRFESNFCDSTLRLDYIFGGKVDSVARCTMLYDGATRSQGWAGRRHRLDRLPLQGNGSLAVLDGESGDTLYVTSFSTLFQEWLSTPEAKEVARSWENSFLIPQPRRKARVALELRDSHGEPMASLEHPLDPADILIADAGALPVQPHRVLHRGGDPATAIDVAIIAEGYTVAEMEKFYADASAAVEAIFSHEPFASRKDCFNFTAVAAPSSSSGVSVPGKGEWHGSACGSAFDTFYSPRYLTTVRLKQVHSLLGGIPYEHIIILANTPVYGGGGIYNFYTLTTAGHAKFRPVVVHEFGHSFGGLADEYFYEDDTMLDEAMYHPGNEPWEPNLTTLHNPGAKWLDMLQPGTPVPTPAAGASRWPVGVYEGGGYQTHGVYRPADDCRMRTNTCPGFCPVCRRALGRLIDFYTLP